MDSIEWDQTIPDAVEALGPSVPSIAVDRRVRDPSGRAAFMVEAGGSGLALDEDGLVLTNQHVVDGAERVWVTAHDGVRRPARVLGEDESTDLALLRADAPGDLRAATLGDSERLRVGQLALAVGHSLGLPGGPTASVGVISALGRPLPGSDFVWEGLLQTDAAINPGNSGGPLADSRARVVGINAATVPSANGIGFAIPVNTAKLVVEQLRRHGRVVRPWLGISGAAVTPTLRRRFDLPTESGVWLAEVVPGSPAAAAGLRAGDVLVGVEAQTVARLGDLLRALAAFPMGETPVVSFLRDGQPHRTAVRLAERPRSEIPERPRP